MSPTACCAGPRVARARGPADRQHPQRAASQRGPLAARRQLDVRVGRAARPHHLRFFTRREIEKLFFRAGFAVEEMRSVSRRATTTRRAGAARSRSGRLRVVGLSDAEADEFYAYQYLVRARPARVPECGLTSIVIVTHNQLEYTRQCLDSMRRLTDEPYELIVVDNGSTDGTVEYLRALAGVRLIVNETNRGFPAAANQGIAAATRRQVLLLNNDVVVTTGWLGRLLRALHSDPAIGLVGPCSNCVSGPQQVEVGYDEPGRPGRVRLGWGKANDGVRVEVSRLVGLLPADPPRGDRGDRAAGRAVRHRLLRGRRLFPAGEPGGLSRRDRGRRVRPPFRRADVRGQWGRFRGAHATRTSGGFGRSGRSQWRGARWPSRSTASDGQA